MRSEKLYDALTEVDDELLPTTALSEQKRGKKPRLRWVGAIAAVVALAIMLTLALRPNGTDEPTGYGGLSAYALETPVYPESAPYPDYSSLMSGGQVDNEALQAAYDAWYRVWQRRVDAGKRYAGNTLQSYLTAAIPAYLGGHDGENVSCSPLNLYLALAMLAETTDGETRSQILSLLGVEDMDRLRTVANSLFLANYSDDGATKSLLAGAIWLRDDMSYDAETVKRLAETYYCASFRGTMGSAEYDEALHGWLNEQTDNQLADQTGGLSFDPRTVLALTTTVDFAARWGVEFPPERTDNAVFHARNGDVDCRMMHRDDSGTYYWGEKFGATELWFKESGRMRVLLPDEGVTAESLLQDPEAISFLLSPQYGSWENSKNLIVRLSMPKFDVSSQLDLKQTLQKLGLTDVFDPNAADFTPLTEDEGVFLSEVKHGARVAVDEEGVTAAAYTFMMMDGAGAPPDEEIDFTLDRPFVFAIYGADNLPLFVGIVNQP